MTQNSSQSHCIWTGFTIPQHNGGLLLAHQICGTCSFHNPLSVHMVSLLQEHLWDHLGVDGQNENTFHLENIGKLKLSFCVLDKTVKN